MKTVYSFIDYPLDLIGGAQSSAQSIAQGLKRKGFKVTIVTPRIRNKELLNSLKIIEYKFVGSKWDLLRKISIYSNILKNHNISYVHAHFPISAIALSILKIFPKNKKLKIIYTDRGLLEEYKIVVRILLKFVAFQSEAIVTTTAYNQQEWIRRTKNKKIKLIPNSVNFEFAEVLINKMTRTSRKVSNLISIGFAGRYTSMKNWPMVLQIILELNKLELKYETNIAISHGPDDYSQMLDFLDKVKAICPENHLRTYINCTQEEMVEFYSSTDIFILTSLSESFGKTAIEAMSVGCVVFGTNYGGLREVIGRKDFLFELNESLEMAKKIEVYSNNENLYLNDSNYFLNRYKDKFSVDANTFSHIALYNHHFFNK
jgi:glycosyltransferase involved in cell wall biosynthesis